MIKLEYKKEGSTKWESIDCLSFSFGDVGIRYHLEASTISYNLMYSDIKEWKAGGKISDVQKASCDKVMAV